MCVLSSPGTKVGGQNMDLPRSLVLSVALAKAFCTFDMNYQANATGHVTPLLLYLRHVQMT